VHRQPLAVHGCVNLLNVFRIAAGQQTFQYTQKSYTFVLKPDTVIST
jgi:hypothetical protein